MKGFEIGTLTRWGGDTYPVTVWFENGNFFAVLGHRKFQVSFSPKTGIRHEVK